MTLKIPIGLSDFRMLREQGAWYVDKTALLVGVLDSATQVFLFPRPRRFGKTLNLSTLRYFVDKPVQPWDATPLYKDLAVWRSEAARAHFQRYPTIAMSFKDVKERTWEATWAGIRREIARVFGEHRYLLDASIPEDVAAEFKTCLSQDADPSALAGALAFLSRLLHRHHGEPVVLLIDEYDVPIQAGYMGGFYEDVITFFRTFLTAGLKDNTHLFKGVLTGVLRIAKESIFSGLNNPEMWSMLSVPFSSEFGFTEGEVQDLLEALGQPERIDEVRRWYDGYRFAGATVYNPWSVLNFARNPLQGGRPYWVHTSSDDVLRRLLLEKKHALAPEIEALMSGGTLTREVDDNIVYADVDHNPNVAFSLLLMSGYLTAREQRLVDGTMICDLAIPNQEIRNLYRTVISRWLDDAPERPHNAQLVLRAMLSGDVEAFSEYLSDLVIRTFSYHDTGGDAPERVYHAFLLGLLVHLGPTHEVRSDRESGFGRCDVMVLPKAAGGTGVVLELKRLNTRRGETVENALASALDQIKTRKYVDEVRTSGAGTVREYGVVFDGKMVWVGVG